MIVTVSGVEGVEPGPVVQIGTRGFRLGDGPATRGDAIDATKWCRSRRPDWTLIAPCKLYIAPCKLYIAPISHRMRFVATTSLAIVASSNLICPIRGNTRGNYALRPCQCLLWFVSSRDLFSQMTGTANDVQRMRHHPWRQNRLVATTASPGVTPGESKIRLVH